MSRFQNTLKGLRILVAEDEVFILMDIEDMLHELGCEIVGAAATVETALAFIRENQLDGALLDMNLNGERIDPVVEELVTRGVRFVLATGYSGQPGDNSAIRGAPRLAKPFTLGSLHSVMSETFDR